MKTEYIYKGLIQTIKVLCASIRPSHFMFDFEQAITNIVRSGLDPIIVTVCLSIFLYLLVGRFNACGRYKNMYKDYNPSLFDAECQL